jgi:hypothetical protein
MDFLKVLHTPKEIFQRKLASLCESWTKYMIAHLLPEETINKVFAELLTEKKLELILSKAR